MLDSLRIDAMERVPETIDEIEQERDPATLDKLVRQLCDDFEVLAVASLLVDGKPQSFFTNLCRAAANWARYLEYRDARQWPKAPVVHTAPMVGAMVAGQWGLATALAQTASSGERRATDYEDEYQYARLLIELAKCRGRRTAEVASLLAAVVGADQGLFAPKLAVVEALLAAEAGEIRERFADAVSHYDQQVEEQSKMLTIDQRKLEPRKYLWLEGLAFLRLAELNGIEIADNYLYCPPLARVPMAKPYAGDWTVTFRA